MTRILIRRGPEEMVVMSAEVRSWSDADRVVWAFEDAFRVQVLSYVVGPGGRSWILQIDGTIVTLDQDDFGNLRAHSSDVRASELFRRLESTLKKILEGESSPPKSWVFFYRGTLRALRTLIRKLSR